MTTQIKGLNINDGKITVDFTSGGKPSNNIIGWFYGSETTAGKSNDPPSNVTHCFHFLGISDPTIMLTLGYRGVQPPKPFPNLQNYLVLGGAGGNKSIWGNINCPSSSKPAGKGNGQDPGYFCKATLAKLTDSLFNDVKNAGFQGICYDIEVGDSTLTPSDFTATFIKAKNTGLSVAVTTSGTAPYGFDNKDVLRADWVKNKHIDMFMPQMYYMGDKYLPNYGDPILKDTIPKLVPAIPKPTDYPTFIKEYPNASGYSIWYAFKDGPPLTKIPESCSSNKTFSASTGDGCWDMMRNACINCKGGTYTTNKEFDKLLCSYTDTNGKTVPITSANNCSSGILTGGKYTFNCNAKC